MIELSKNTKKARGFINAFNWYKNQSEGNSIYEIYTKPSRAKSEAFIYCHRLVNEYRGYMACFGGHSCHFFSYMFLFNKNNKTYLAYITKEHDYMIEYEE